MAIIKTGTITSAGAAYNLALGFTPSYIRIVNHTKLAAQSGVAVSEWYSSMVNASAYQSTVSAGAPVLSYITSNGFTPYSTADSALYTATNKTITGISKAANASVTSTSHGLSVGDIVTFHGVVGMVQINTLTGTVQTVADANTFTVNINSTGFTTYGSGGIANVISGITSNSGTSGITLGTSIAGSASDVLRYEAVLDTPVTS